MAASGNHRLLLFSAAVLVILSFAFQGSRGLWEPDEGYYAGIAQAMVETGDYVVPRLQQDTYLDKPPLSMWGIAAGLRVLGHNEWGARAFLALCYVLTGLLVYRLGTSLGSRREGWLGMIVWATMVFPFAAANVITPDTPLALWTTAATLCFWESIKPGAQRIHAWQMLMCAALGLGFLTKGPAALIPSGAFFVYLLCRGRVREYFLTPWAIPGIILFGLLGLTWYAIIAAEIPGALGYFLDNQVIGRTLTSKYNRHPGLLGAAIYLPVIFGGTLPWSLWWTRILVLHGRDWWRKTWREKLPAEPAAQFLALWIAVPLTILCLASSKLPLYPLPIFPALALATARSMVRRGRAPLAGDWIPGFSRRTVLLGLSWVLFMVGVKYYVSCQLHTPKDMRALHAAIAPHLPKRDFEIVSVNEHLEAVGFYEPVLIESVTTKNTPYPCFVQPGSLAEEIEEMATTKQSLAIVRRKEEHAEELRNVLSAARIPFREYTLPFNRYLFVCAPPGEASCPVRLAVLGDIGHGFGNSDISSTGRALWQLYGDRSFTDGVLLLGDNLDNRLLGHGDKGPEALAEVEFERPFKPLLDAGIPFYALLGNHDLKSKVDRFELTYRLFHMNGQRYGRHSFGTAPNDVDVFYLDSNVLSKEDPAAAEQLAWLDTALGQSQAQWKVVALHHPIRSTAKKYPANPNRIRLLEPILLRHGVSLVLQGHNHVYERLQPVDGIHYLTVGSGSIVNTDDLILDAPVRAAGNDQGQVMVLLEFTREQCDIRAYDLSGDPLDHVAVDHGPAATQPSSPHGTVDAPPAPILPPLPD